MMTDSRGRSNTSVIQPLILRSLRIVVVLELGSQTAVGRCCRPCAGDMLARGRVAMEMIECESVLVRSSVEGREAWAREPRAFKATGERGRLDRSLRASLGVQSVRKRYEDRVRFVIARPPTSYGAIRCARKARDRGYR